MSKRGKQRYMHEFYRDKVGFYVDRYEDGAFLNNAVLYALYILSAAGAGAILKILL